MRKQKVNSNTISIYNTLRKMRQDWGNINPVTKVICNKKHEYQFPDSYYDYETREEEIENTIDLDEWGDW